MKLTKVRITNFQSIQDSTEFDICDVTCLVGKNEAGKTALLKALYRLNPILEADGDFDPTDDFPRRAVSDYENEVEAGHREPAQVVTATYALEPEDITAVEDVFGPECLNEATPTITLSKGYANKCSYSGLELDQNAAIRHLVESADLPQSVNDQIRSLDSAEQIIEALTAAEQTDALENLRSTVQDISDQDVSSVIWNSILRDRIPKFLYFDEYYQLKGQDNVGQLQQRLSRKPLRIQTIRS